MLAGGPSSGLSLLLVGPAVCFRTSLQTLLEGLRRGASVRTTTLVRALAIVGDKVLVERGLHLVDDLEPGAPTFDPEVFVEQRAVETFHDAGRLRTVDPRGAVLDVLELEEQLVGIAVGAPAELTSVMREHHCDAPACGFERGHTSLFIR